MENSLLDMNISRRRIIFKIARLATSKLITGNYRFPNVSEISAEDLHQRLSSDQPPLVVDTRPTGEFTTGFGHIPGSKHIPLMELVMTFTNTDEFKKEVKQLEAQFAEVMDFQDREVVTICPGGGFSLVAAEIMAEAGFKDVKSLSGGADGWFKQDFPTTLA